MYVIRSVEYFTCTCALSIIWISYKTNGLVDCFKTCICNCVNKETFKCYNTRLFDKADVQIWKLPDK